jgi:hypothetical protein
LTVNGSNFVAGGTLTWNGQNLGTYQLVSSTQITIVIGASLIMTPGSVSIGVSSAGVAASNTLSLAVNPLTTSACLLFGSYDFFFTGFDNNGPVTIAGDFGVDASGAITGEQDFKDLKSTNAAQPITGGSCTNAATPNEGTLTLTTSTGAFSYAFVAQTLPATGAKGRLSGGGLNGLTGSGRFNFVPGGFFLGDYVLGVVGSNSTGGRMGVLGRFTDTTPGAGTAGTLSNGLGDINNGGTLSASLAITGTVGVPDVYSRSAATLTVGTQALQMAFYVVNSNVAFVVNADPSAAAPLLAGFANSQASYGMLNSGNLSAPVIVSTWGAAPGGAPASATLLARASNFNAGAGTFDLLLDEVAGGVVASSNQTIAGATYSIASTGRGTAAFTPAGGTAHSYVLYLDASNDGYLLDASANVAFGFFSAQAAGPFTNASINGTFAAGTWFSPVATSPNTTGVLTLSNGVVSGLGAGTYLVDPSGVGRGTATVNPGFGSNSMVFYIIGPNALEIMGSDPVTNDAIAFMNR